MEGSRSEKPQIPEGVETLSERKAEDFVSPVGGAAQKTQEQEAAAIEEKSVRTTDATPRQDDIVGPESGGGKNLERGRKLEELEGVYKKIRSLKTDEEFLLEEIERIGSLGFVIKPPRWPFKEQKLRELIYEKKQIILAQEKREELEVALEKTETDLRTAEVLRDRLEQEIYPPETAERLGREREEAALALRELERVATKKEEEAKPDEVAKEEKAVTVPARKKKPESMEFVGYDGSEALATGANELGEYRIGDELVVNPAIVNKTVDPVKAAKRLVVVGFTENGHIIIQLDDDRVTVNSEEVAKKYFKKVKKVDGFQTARGWIESQIPKTTPVKAETSGEKSPPTEEETPIQEGEASVEKPPEKIAWIDGEEFQESQLLSGVETLGGYQIGDRLRVREGEEMEVGPKTRVAKKIKVFGFTRKGGAKDEVVLILDDRLLTRNTPRMRSQKFEFIGR